ncbi:hypothetical protein [Haloprofundus halophilus]|uniref:hypothetical protein n=1 Tax=Haloprofundus halophilus TaxID=2283527 RepID=UPI0013005BD4|nr:hypothetical protein [Haloprofundus halophilus]
MAQAYPSRMPTETGSRVWTASALAGLVAGIAMGLVMQFVMNAMPLIGALVGQPTVVGGWVLHLVISVVFALTFAAIITRTSLSRYGRTTLGTVGLGLAYGAVLTVVAGWFALPIWANAVGAGPLPVPLVVPMGVVTHLLYGLVLGGVYAYARGTTESEPTEETNAPA